MGSNNILFYACLCFSFRMWRLTGACGALFLLCAEYTVVMSWLRDRTLCIDLTMASSQ